MEIAVTGPGDDDELTALAGRVRGGNAAAFDELARRVRDRVRQWARRVVADDDDAEDVAQLVLVQLHQRIGEFEGRSRFATWLYRVTGQYMDMNDPAHPWPAYPDATAAFYANPEAVALYHDHVLVKEPGTRQRTPWHQDQPYYNVDGVQNASMWFPVDPVDRSATLEFIAGTHRGPWYMPTSSSNRRPLTSMRWQEPVTVRSAPQN